MSEVVLLVIKSFFYILPAGIATMLPPIAAKLSKTPSTPLDFGKTIGGKPIFGSHKTFRGLLVGLLGGALGIILEAQIITSLNAEHLSLFPLSLNFKTAFLGSLLGFGAIAGDAVKSFFKRRLDIKPGKSWFPLDQIDWVIGAIVFTSPIITLPARIIITLLIVGIVLHLLSKTIGYLIGINTSFI